MFLVYKNRMVDNKCWFLFENLIHALAVQCVTVRKDAHKNKSNISKKLFK